MKLALKRLEKSVRLRGLAEETENEGDVFHSLKSKLEPVIGRVGSEIPEKAFANSIKEILENKNFGKNNLLEGKKIMVEYTFQEVP